MSTYKFFSVHEAGDVTVIRLADTDLFDSAVVSELQDLLFELIELEKPTKVVIDFSEVQHCSSAVISQLLHVKHRIVAAGGELKLCGQSDLVRDVFRVLSLDKKVFDIYDTQSAAVEAFGTA